MALDGTDRAQFSTEVQDFLSEFIFGVFTLESAYKDRNLLLTLHQGLFLDADFSLQVAYGSFLFKEKFFKLSKAWFFLLWFATLEGFGLLELAKELNFFFLHIADLGLQGLHSTGEVLVLFDKLRTGGFVLIIQDKQFTWVFLFQVDKSHDSLVMLFSKLVIRLVIILLFKEGVCRVWLFGESIKILFGSD